MLLKSFKELLGLGHTLVVVEHNIDLIKCADNIIDLGPEGGENGGYIVAQGTPEDISKNKESLTGYYLKRSYSFDYQIYINYGMNFVSYFVYFVSYKKYLGFY